MPYPPNTPVNPQGDNRARSFLNYEHTGKLTKIAVANTAILSDGLALRDTGSGHTSEHLNTVALVTEGGSTAANGTKFMSQNHMWNKKGFDTLRPILSGGTKPVGGKYYTPVGRVQVDLNGNAIWGKKDPTDYYYVAKTIRYVTDKGNVFYAHGYYQETATPTPPNSYPDKPVRDPNKYKWNLPPHAWSVPLMPAYTGFMPDGYKKAGSGDRYRRGRIWWHSNDPNSKIFKQAAAGKKTTLSTDDSRRYGFQFIWNPESFTTGISVQLEATPDTKDRFLAVAGVFPGTESISFNIRVDRTNDFAAAGNLGRPSDIEHVKGTPFSNFLTAKDVKDLIPYYKRSGTFSHASKDSDVINQLIDLFQRGTIADIEYLYRAINGSGPSAGDKWVNSRGQHTADIGFLMPTLLNVDIGPLSYQGYVTSMNVTHLAFTPDMTPIRSDVTVSLNLLATAGITSDKVLGKKAN